MAGGLAFDPAEFASFKTGRSSLPPAPAGGGFDPAEFTAFKNRTGRQDAPATTRQASPFDQDGGATFADRFGSGPMASGLEQAATGDQAALGEGLRRVADERLIGKPSAANAVAAGVLRAGNAAGLNIPRNAAAGIATAAGYFGVPGYLPRSFSESYQRAQDQEEALARQNPGSALAGTATGIVSGAVALPSVPVRQGAGLAARTGANFLTGAGYGTAAEAWDSKDLGRTATAGAIGGALGAGGGYLIERAAPVVAGLFRRGVPVRGSDGNLTAEASAALREAGIDPATITPGIEAAFREKGLSGAVAREALAAEQGITLSRGQATQDPRALDLEGGAASGARGARAQGIADEFTARQASELAAGRDRLQRMAAGDAPLIDSPQSALEAVADRARMARDTAAGTREAAQRAQDDAMRAVRGGGGDVLDGATAAVQGVRDAAGRARAGYRAAYDEVAAIPGSFEAGALDRMGSRVRDRLGADVPIDPVLTPAAARAINDLDALPGLFGLRPGEGPNLQQVDQLRKRLVSYRGGTSANPTDRRAMDRILAEFDGHIEDAMSVGLFGSRPGSSGAAADAFPGDAAISAAAARPAAPEPGGPRESLLTYLGRNGGIPLDDEARAADLNRLYVPGGGTLARRNAPSWDDLRVRLTEAGFFPYDEFSAATSRDVADRVREAIRAERQGRPTYRFGDEAPTGRAAERVADENADYASAIDRQSRRMMIDLEGYGLRPQDLDRAALDDAAGMMLRREVDDAGDAYDLAVSRRAASAEDPAATAPRGPAPSDEVPFPEIGEGVSRAASDALPIGDTRPAEAMRRARGLFRDYKQAFSPRGPGDTAGQRLRAIVDREASPSDVVSVLFGSTTGRIAPGQLQTLTRLRDVVGTDSEAFGAVRQSILARYLDGDARGLSDRLNYLVTGEGRPLLSFLTEEQRAGLSQLRAATAAAQGANAPLPGWVASLERSGFDPNAIASSLFGSGVPGTRVGATNEARAAKAFLGDSSAEWAGLRQAGIRQLVDLDLTGNKLASRIREFTDGRGRGVASEMFSAEELGQLRRFAAAISTTDRPVRAVRANEGKAAGIAAKALDALAGAIAFKVGGPGAGLAAYGAKVGQRALLGGVGTARARGSFEGGAPRVRPSYSVPATGGAGVAAGLYASD